MERIVLEVDSASARAWRNLSPSRRVEYEGKINAVLKELQEAETIEGEVLNQQQINFLKIDAGNVDKRYEWWSNDETMAELKRRSADLDSGKDKGVPWDEARTRLLNRGKMR